MVFVDDDLGGGRIDAPARACGVSVRKSAIDEMGNAVRVFLIECVRRLVENFVGWGVHWKSPSHHDSSRGRLVDGIARVKVETTLFAERFVRFWVLSRSALRDECRCSGCATYDALFALLRAEGVGRAISSRIGCFARPE